MTTWPASIARAISGGLGLAASFNNHADALDVQGGAWATYAPAWNGTTTSPTLGASALRQLPAGGQDGRRPHQHHHRLGFVAGSGNYTFGLPPGCATLNNGASEALGIGTARDVSAPSTYPFVVYYTNTSTVGMVARDGAGNQQLIGSAAPFTWATGDRITLHLPALEIV
jgi:hypothetical protein